MPLTKAASMLCGWLHSSVERLVVNITPHTLSSTMLLDEEAEEAGAWLGCCGCGCG